MRIQTFFLCNSISKNPLHHGWEGEKIGAHHFFPKDGQYPFCLQIPFFLLLSKQSRSHEKNFTLTFTLCNADKLPVGSPNGVITNGHFPAGHRFLEFTGYIDFEIPEKADYMLEIRINEKDDPYYYEFECGLAT